MGKMNSKRDLISELKAAVVFLVVGWLFIFGAAFFLSWGVPSQEMRLVVILVAMFWAIAIAKAYVDLDN